MDNLTLPLQFDAKAAGAEEGRRRRDAGKAKAAGKFEKWLKWARDEAAKIAFKRGEVCSDDLHPVCPLPAEAHPNLWGSVFKCDAFEFVRFQPSNRPERHAGVIRVYRLKGASA